MTDQERRIIEGLAERFGWTRKINPDWDRRAEREAWQAGEDYAVPEYVPMTVEEMARATPMIIFTDCDGHRSMRSATLAEIAEAVAGLADQ